MKKNILVWVETFPPDLGGAGKIVSQQLKYLIKFYNFTVITTSKVESPFSENLKIITFNKNNRLYYFLFCLLYSLKKHKEFDLVFGHGIAFCPFLFLLMKMV